MTSINMKMKVPVPFPAQVQGIGGIGVSKSAGIWTVEPQFSDLAEIDAAGVSDPTSKQIWIFDPITGEYNVLTLAGLGDALYTATSTTSLTIGTGSKVFTTQSGKDFGVGSFVLATSDADPANYMLGQVTDYTDTALTVSISTVSGSGTHADWTIRGTFSPGAQGRSSGHSYLWNTSTSATDPGAGQIAANNATLSSATALYISETDHDSNSLASVIATWDDGNSVIKGRLKIYDPVSPANFVIFDITGTNTDNGTYDTINVSYVASGGTLANSEAVYVLFIPKGDKGDLGGIPWTFSTTTTMANPGTGAIRLNNATLSSVTAIAISANSADTGNPSFSAYINTWDDSTNSGNRGTLIIRKNGAPQNEAIYKISGALTDNTTWLQIPVAFVSSNGSFSASDQLEISFYRTGDTGGGDLLAANNLSDVSNPATALANLGGSAITRSIDAQTGTTYTFVIGDAGKLCSFSNASAITVTVPPNSSVAFPVGTQIDVVQLGAGKVTLAQGAGVTINSVNSNKSLSAQYAGGTLIKTATDTWILTGSLIA